MRHKIRLCVAVCLCLINLRPAAAWGPLGHRVAGLYAEQLLEPRARAEMRRILEPGETLADASTWADENRDLMPPGSAGWHFVNVPITARRYEARFGADRRGSVVPKIAEYRRVLADGSASLRKRREALRLVVHFVQDVHQPLHVGENRDRGGNDTQISFRGQTENLHRLWDSTLIRSIHRRELDWLDDLEAFATPDRRKGWMGTQPEEWATESLDAARRAYRHPRENRDLVNGDRLDERYLEAATPVLRLRLAQAAVRTAEVLNDALGAHASTAPAKAAAGR
jgi:hypothetical protein